MKLTFLGTGTSCGVPTIGCQCRVCQSTNAKDKRLRCSALLETEHTRLLIDCGPDFRQQIMPHPFRRIDGILITHAHYDHMGGMDDIRPFCQFGEISVYADAVACKGLLQMLPYCFAEHRYPGVPAIGLHEIQPHVSFTIGDIEILPFLEGVTTLVVNALRIAPHHSHQTLADAIAFARRVGAARTLFIHSSHDIGLHDEVNAQLPDGMEMAYDGQVISF